MLTSIKQGWSAAWRQPFLLIVLFLYRFAWGFAIYRFVQSVVEPILHRYPGSLMKDQARLFMAEAEFQLTKTDISHGPIRMLLILLAARMLATPLLNAGIYYSLAHPQLNTGYRFFKGMRSLGGSFYLWYTLQMVLTLAPAWLLLPKWKLLLEDYTSLPSHLTNLAPAAGVWLLWGFVLNYLFMHVQFGSSSSASPLRSLLFYCRKLLPILGSALLLLLLSVLLSGLVFAATMIWAGMWALLLQQAFGFVRTLFSLWNVTTQQRLYAKGHEIW